MGESEEKTFGPFHMRDPIPFHDTIHLIDLHLFIMFILSEKVLSCICSLSPHSKSPLSRCQLHYAVARSKKRMYTEKAT